MLTLNSRAPDFSLQCVEGGKTFTWSLADYRKRWIVLVFYPADFTFVCPTEVRGFEARAGEFRVGMIALPACWVLSVLALLGVGVFKGVMTGRPLAVSGLEFASIALGSAAVGWLVGWVLVLGGTAAGAA